MSNTVVQLLVHCQIGNVSGVVINMASQYCLDKNQLGEIVFFTEA